MPNIVFLEPNKIDAVPFTASDVIAEYSKNSHHAIQQMVSKHEKSLKEFGQVAFEMRAVTYSRGTNQEKVYHLNEPQATLLITFLKNTAIVVKFKVELVRQFYLMRAELMKRHMLRTDLKPIRRELTDVIQNNPEHSKWDFKLYTDLAYKVAIGRNAAQIRKDRNAKKNAVAVDYMSSDEIAKISKLQSQIAVLIEMGMDYHQIKAIVLNRQFLIKTA